MTRLKVCVLGTRGIPGVLGGVEAHCEALYPLLAQNANVDVVVLARKKYVAPARASFKGVQVVPLPAPHHPHLEAFVHTLRGVFDARFVHRADIVHFHGIGPALMAPLARLLGMKAVVTHHSRNYLHEKWNKFARGVLRVGEWCACAFANGVIVVSPSMAAEMRERYSRPDAITHIPNGAPDFGAPPTVEEQQAVLDKFGLERGRFFMGVGRLTPEKGFHDLVAAYKRASPDMPLVIAGKADFENEYSRDLTANASAKIVFAGFQDRRALQAFYANAALFVLPSHHEGMPIAALEALSFGAPILLSDIEANRDLDLPAAHYFPVGDLDALAERLRADPANFRFDGRAMLARFQWDEIAQRTIAVYNNVALAPDVAGSLHRPGESHT